MTAPKFLTEEDVFFHHGVATARQSTADGVHSLVAIQSATAAPETRFHYEGQDWTDRFGIAALAATYWVHLTLCHGFVDGNKRVGFACFLAFLYTNGYDVSLTNDEAISISLQIAERKLSRDDTAREIFDRLTPLA